MKKKILVLFLTGILALLLLACGGTSSTDETDDSNVAKEKEYLSDEQIDELFHSPENFKGKYVKLIGKVFTTPEKSDKNIRLQLYYDIPNYDKNFIVYYTGTESIAIDDYLLIDGLIKGEFKGKNFIGSNVSVPLIETNKIEVTDYITAVVPTTKEITLTDSTITQHDVSITYEKIQFSDLETRIYLSATNNSNDTFNLHTYSAKIIQNGQQIEASFANYDADYPEVATSLLAGASSSGIIVFPALEETNFQIYLEGYSDNWELDFSPFALEVPIN
ncbi:MAG TPA: hypothetical protein H9887_06340 [Candidatus Dorea intestinavium]|nr:hypothetical protein [Candidatus Dorea intestinavium]